MSDMVLDFSKWVDFIAMVWNWCFEFLNHTIVKVGNFRFSFLGLFIALFIMSITISVAFNVIKSGQANQAEFAAKQFRENR